MSEPSAPIIDPRFLQVISGCNGLLTNLLACPPFRFDWLPAAISEKGVYLFSENQSHLYVGRSNSLRKRYLLHCRRGSQQNQASFAYKLALETLGISKASDTLEGTRTKFAATEAFINAFAIAKARVRAMDYRFVEVGDQTQQALLETYAIVVLGTPHNDFNTH